MRVPLLLNQLDLFGGILMGCNGQILSCTSLKFLAIAMAIPKNFASFKIKFAAISLHQLPTNKSIYLLLLLCSSLLLSAQMAWQPTTLAPDAPVFCFHSQEDTLFAGFHGGGLYKTYDEGLTWIACNNGLDDPRINAMTQIDSTLFVGSFSGVFSSNDGGQTWQSASNSILHREIWSLISKDSLLIAGTASGIYLSSDKGQHWIKALLPPPKGHHQTIFSLGTMGQRIVGTSSRYVYDSQDNGLSWRRIRVPTEMGIFSLVHHQNDLWVGTGGDGVMRSPTTGSGSAIIDQGMGMTGNVLDMISVDGVLITSTAVNGVFKDSIYINEGFLEPQVHRLAYHRGKLYAGTFDLGVWKYDLIPDPLQETEERNASSPLIGWKDLKVFPNPAQEEQVQIWYRVPESSEISIEFYRANGQRLASVLQQQQAKGSYSQYFDLRPYPPGNYYFSYRLGKDIITRPIFILK